MSTDVCVGLVQFKVRNALSRFERILLRVANRPALLDCVARSQLVGLILDSTVIAGRPLMKSLESGARRVSSRL